MQLRLGQTDRSSRVSIGVPVAPARAHDHAQDGAGGKARRPAAARSSTVGHEGLSGLGPRAERGVVRRGSAPRTSVPAATSTPAALTKTRMIALTIGWRRRRRRAASTGWGSRRRKARHGLDVEQALALVLHARRARSGRRPLGGRLVGGERYSPSVRTFGRPGADPRTRLPAAAAGIVAHLRAGQVHRRPARRVERLLDQGVSWVPLSVRRTRLAPPARPRRAARRSPGRRAGRRGSTRCAAGRGRSEARSAAPRPSARRAGTARPTTSGRLITASGRVMTESLRRVYASSAARKAAPATRARRVHRRHADPELEPARRCLHQIRHTDQPSPRSRLEDRNPRDPRGPSPGACAPRR